jgi:hypothetical protein
MFYLLYLVQKTFKSLSFQLVTKVLSINLCISFEAKNMDFNDYTNSTRVLYFGEFEVFLHYCTINISNPIYY